MQYFIGVLLVISMMYYLPINTSLISLSLFITSIFIIKIVAQFITGMHVNFFDSAKASIYSIVFTFLAYYGFALFIIDKGPIPMPIVYSVYFIAQMVAYSLSLKLSIVGGLVISFLTTLIALTLVTIFNYLI